MTGSILLVNCAAVSKSVFPSDQTGCYRCQTENKPHICFRSENFQRFSVSGTDQLTSPLRNSAHSTMNGKTVVLFFSFRCCFGFEFVRLKTPHWIRSESFGRVSVFFSGFISNFLKQTTANNSKYITITWNRQKRKRLR